MKLLIVFLLSFFISILSLASGVGGLSGGNAPRTKAQLVTARVCDGGESGEMCRTIHYVDRPKSNNLEPECYIARGEVEVPCPKNYSKENFIKDLYENYISLGIQTHILVRSL